MVQIENEYGSYGKDKDYLALNEKMFRSAGFDGLLYTCDPPQDLPDGYLSGLLPAVNGLVKPDAVKALVRKYHNNKGPFFIAEWYPAWFDWWGTKHHRIAPESYGAELDSVLAAGLSINMYMFHGGTTRGFMNGANFKDSTPYEPQISSYDYDAPLDEAGNPTEKFKIFRSVIEKHLPKGTMLPPVPASKPTMAINNIDLTKRTYLLDALPAAVTSDTPITFEHLHQAYGYVLYRTIVDGDKSSTLKVNELRDYAVVLVNGVPQGTIDRRLGQNTLNIQLPPGRDTLDLFVENLGRINFGPYLLQNNKGIIGKVLLGGRALNGWSMFGFPFSSLKDFKWQHTASLNKGPVLLQGNFKLDSLADTYFDMSSWGKGVVWVNGHNLGRYWKVGPQQTIYVPKEWLSVGDNTVTVLEELKADKKNLSAIAHPILDSLQK
jgi:beta-galactosidase